MFSFCFLFPKYVKNYWNYFDKKTKQIHGIAAYNKALYNTHRNIYIVRNLIILFMANVSACVTKFSVRSSSKNNKDIKMKFYIYIFYIENKSWLNFGWNRAKN